MDRHDVTLRRLLTRALAALCAAGAPAAFASGDGPSYDPLPRAMPTVPMSQFAGGRPGVLDGTFQDGYLVVAWRVLARHPLSAAEVAAVQAALADSPQYMNSTDWNGALREAGGAAEDLAHNDDWSRSVDLTVDGVRNFVQFDNCNASTQSTAIETLQARIKEHGSIASSPWVAEWAHGQAVVLSNCAGGPALPKVLGKDAPTWLRQDRDYQRASALFYSMQYDKARDAFEAIAADKASPWADFGQYLAARSMLRASSLAAKPADQARYAADALKRFDAVARTGSARVRPWAAQLRARAAIAVDPAATLLQASTTLDKAEWGDQGQVSFENMLYQPRPASLASEHGNLAEWLSIVRQAPSLQPTWWTLPVPGKGEKVVDLAAERERACTLAAAPRSDNPAAWAVACVMLARQLSDIPAPVLAAIRKLPADHPAHATLGYYVFQARLRAIATLPEAQRAAARLALRTEIDAAIAKEADAYRADGVNALKLLRVPLATDGAAMLRDTRLRDVAGYVEAYSWKREDGRNVDKGEVDSDLRAELLERVLSVNALARLSAEPGLDAATAQGLLLKAWQRSVLLGQGPRQMELAREVARRAPQWAKDVAAIEGAPNIAQARYEWASRAYRQPTPFGNGHVGLDVDTAKAGQPPALLGWLKPEEAAERSAELTVKPVMPTEAQTLGAAVIDWAKSHPKDPRLAGDLASVVTQYKYSFHPKGTPQYVPQSREAFLLLHKLFPRSDEAAETKYFY